MLHFAKSKKVHLVLPSNPLSAVTLRLFSGSAGVYLECGLPIPLKGLRNPGGIHSYAVDKAGIHSNPDVAVVTRTISVNH